MVTFTFTPFFHFILPFIICLPIIACVTAKEHPKITSTHSHTSLTTSHPTTTTKPPLPTTTQTPTTTPSGLPLNSPCSNSSVCGRNTFCQATSLAADPSGVCRCLLGYLPSQANHIDCTAFNCTATSGGEDDNLFCHSTFNSNFTRCNSSSSLCICDVSFSLNASSQTCLPTKTPLNGNCQSLDQNCGQNAVCNGAQKCQCRLGTLPVAWNRLNCDYYHCSQDQDCLGPFGPNTLCVAGACYCNQLNSTLDHDTQRCIQSGQKVGGNCTRDRECATNANCVEGACRCQFGYTPQANGRDCSVLRCNGTAQCIHSVDVHSSCSSNNGSKKGGLCECTAGYEVSPEMQSCVPSSAQICFSYLPNWLPLLHLILTLLSFIKIFHF